MKHLLIIFSILLTSVSWCIDCKELYTNDGRYYLKYDKKLYTGSVDCEQPEWYANYYVKKGRLDGIYTSNWKYHPYKPRVICAYKKGKKHGQCSIFYSNGNYKTTGNWKKGKRIGKHYLYLSDGTLRRIDDW